MEIGWYLRFAKTDTIEAQISVKSVDQLRHESHIFPDWNFEFDGQDGYVLARMTRKKPLYDTGGEKE